MELFNNLLSEKGVWVDEGVWVVASMKKVMGRQDGRVERAACRERPTEDAEERKACNEEKTESRTTRRLCVRSCVD